MEPLNNQFEKYHGDCLIEWFNESRREKFSFEKRGNPAPDLIYTSGTHRVGIEVTAAYHDPKHAKFLWDGARNPEGPSGRWSGVNPDSNLANGIFDRIREKSIKDYGKGCILLIVIPPGITSYKDLCHLLSLHGIGVSSPFEGIYIAGTFPNINLDSSTGGYRVITIKEYRYAYDINFFLRVLRASVRNLLLFCTRSWRALREVILNERTG